MQVSWPLTGRNDFVVRFWQEIHPKQEDEVCSEMKANRVEPFA